MRIAYILMTMLGLPIAAAGPFPDSWEGELQMREEWRSTNDAGSVHYLYEGKMAIHVNDSIVSGDASITFSDDWNQTPCKASNKVPFSANYPGILNALGADRPGQSFNFRIRTDQAAHYVETLHCGFLGSRTAQRILEPPLLPAQIPLVDGVTTTQTSLPGVGGTGTVSTTLKTPCAGWDSTKDPGPTVKFIVRDPRTVEQPEPPPDYSLDSNQLTAMAAATLSAGENARRAAFGSKDLGLTSHPKAENFHFEFLGLIIAPARKPYAQCLSWTTLELTIPEDKIHTWIASDVGTEGACARYLEDHERRHRKQIWATLQGIASQVEVVARNEIPGPFNQRPTDSPGSEDTVKLAMTSKLESLVNQSIQELSASIQAMDSSPTEQKTGKKQCAAFAGSNKHEDPRLAQAANTQAMPGDLQLVVRN